MIFFGPDVVCMAWGRTNCCWVPQQNWQQNNLSNHFVRLKFRFEVFNKTEKIVLLLSLTKHKELTTILPLLQYTHFYYTDDRRDVYDILYKCHVYNVLLSIFQVDLSIMQNRLYDPVLLISSLPFQKFISINNSLSQKLMSITAGLESDRTIIAISKKDI